MEKRSKTGRIIDIYTRLCDGEIIQKEIEAQRFDVDLRSIQRDIDDIRAYLSDKTVLNGSSCQIVYDRKRKGFVLAGYQSPVMSNSEILAVSKILLESRAFSKTDLFSILNKLVSGCVPQKNMKLVTDLLANEKHHYAELTNPPPIQDTLWDIAVDIRDKHLLELRYQRQDTTRPEVIRVVEPLSILFSEYYFYLNACIVEPDEHGSYRHKHDYPAVFRIDRIVSYRLLREKFRLPYTNRFQEGEFRKRVQFMYPGPLQKISFRYIGPNVDAVLDRLPTAVIAAQDESGYILETEVYGNGILMWLLGQGKLVEVLSPASLRQEMQHTLTQMLAQYQ